MRLWCLFVWHLDVNLRYVEVRLMISDFEADVTPNGPQLHLVFELFDLGLHVRSYRVRFDRLNDAIISVIVRTFVIPSGTPYGASSEECS